MNHSYKTKKQLVDELNQLQMKNEKLQKIIIDLKVGISTDDGKPNEVIGTLTDITECRETENLLQSYKNLINKSPVTTFIWKNNNITFPVEFVSDNASKLFGFSVDDFSSNQITYPDIIHPDDVERVTKEVITYSEDKQCKEFKHLPYRIITKDKQIKWVEDHTNIIRNEVGEITHYQGIVQDITERKNAEFDLRNSKANLIESQKIAKLGHYVFNINTDDWSSSDELNAIFGIDKTYKKDLSTWLQIVHDDFKEEMANYLQNNILKQFQKFDKEYKIIAINSKKEKWVHGLGNLKFDENGNPVEMFGTIQDITERKQIEEALRILAKSTSGDDFFNTMALQLMEIINADFTIIGEWNKEHKDTINTIAVATEKMIIENIEYELSDTPCENVIGKSVCAYTSSVADLFPKDILLSQMGVQGYIGVPLFDSKLNASGILVALFRNPIKNLAFKEAILQIFSLRIESEMERSLSEKTLSNSEEKNRLLVENSPYCIHQFDMQARFLSMNQAGLSMLGLTNEKEILGTSLFEVVHKSNIERVKFLMDEAYKGKASEFEYVSANNKYFSSSFIPIFDDGVVIRLMGITQDITETKRLQQLESRASRLEMAGTIAGQVAHDFNNLLAPIMAYPEFIREELPEDHKAQTYLTTIENAAKKIAEINQDLLTMGRRGHYNQDVININNIISNIVKDMASSVKSITCNTDLAKDIMNIKGGSAQIHRMISNLLVNAQDAIKNDGIITVKTENYYSNNTSIVYGRVPKGDYVKITISDNGHGIPEELIQKILDPFFSTKTANKKRGSGLGLSVVDSVLKDHNGYLDLQSKVGEGSSFFIYFPITKEDSDYCKFELPNGGNEKILVVDDDDMQREVSIKLLTKLGYQASEVKSGEQAIDYLQSNKQDLILLDMVMSPGIDGTETYKRILENNPNQKAIIVSGFSESDRVLEAQKLGVGSFLKKPFTKNQISYAVRTELDRQSIALTS